MLTKIFRWFLLILLISPFLVLPTAVLLSSPEPEEIKPELPKIQEPLLFDTTGRTFEYDSLKITSSEEVRISFLEVVTNFLTFCIEPVTSTAAAETTLIISYPDFADLNRTRWQNGYVKEEICPFDSEGKYQFQQDISKPHHIWFQPVGKGTIYVRGEEGDIIYLKDIAPEIPIREMVVVASDRIIVDGSDAPIIGPGYGIGIYLGYERTGVTVRNCTVQNFYTGIYCTYYSSYNTITNNIANSNENGIALAYCSNITLTGNTTNSNNYNGISLVNASNNTLINNTARSNSEEGITLSGSSFNTLTGNTMSGNKYNFRIWGTRDSHFNNNIDQTNTVDAKPIYYIKNATNTIYDATTNAGIIYCIWCDKITVKDLTLTHNDSGVYFWKTINSTVQNITASHNRYGIYLKSSSNNTLVNNKANSNDVYGIFLRQSIRNTLINNTANSNNSFGIWISWYSSDNTFINNTIKLNRKGIWLYYSFNNILVNNIIMAGGPGILLEHSSGNLFDHNTAVSNYLGISAWFSNNNILTNNTITSNSYGLHFRDSFINAVYHNCVYSNTRYNVTTNGTIELSYDGKGNWWGHGPDDPALFTPGVDSNRLDVTDSHPYAYQDAWRFAIPPGVLPGVYEVQPHELIATIDVGPYPYRLAITPFAIPPARLKTYVLNLDDTISVIDVVNNTVTATIDLGALGLTGLFGVAFSPLGDRAYVAHWQGITIIDVLEDKIIQTLSYPGKTFTDIAVSPCGRYLYVLTSYPYELSIIETITYSLETISLSYYPYIIEVSPDGLEAYITHLGDDTVTVVDLLKGEIKDRITSISKPYDVAFTRAGDKVYITSKIASGWGELIELDTATRAILRHIPVSGRAQFVGLSRDEQFAYVSTQDPSYSVCVVYLPTGEIVKDIPIDKPYGLTGLAITQDGYDCYAINGEWNRAYVISTALHLHRGPVITAISPTEDLPGTEVTITGVGFNPILEENIIHFGISSLPATSVNPEGTELTFKVPVPTCCGTHRVWVEAWGLETNVVEFYVQKPSGPINTVIGQIEDFLREFLAIYGSSHSRPARPGVNLLNKVIQLLKDEKSRMDHLDRLDQGTYVAAMARLEQAIRFLEQWDKMYAKETGLSTLHIREALARYGEALLRLIIYKAEEKIVTLEDETKVWQAQEDLASGSSAVEEGEYLASGHEFKVGVSRIISLKPRIVVGKSETQANWDALPHLPPYIGVGQTVDAGFLIDNTKFEHRIYVTRITITPSANIAWVSYKFEGEFYAPENNTIDLNQRPFYPIGIDRWKSSDQLIKVTCLAPCPATLTLMVDYEYWDPIEGVEKTDSTDPCTGTTNQIGIDKVEWIGIDPGDGKTNFGIGTHPLGIGTHPLVLTPYVALGSGAFFLKMRLRLGRSWACTKSIKLRP